MRYRRNDIVGPKANVATTIPYTAYRMARSVAQRRRVTLSFALCQLIELGLDALAGGADFKTAGKTNLFSKDFRTVQPRMPVEEGTAAKIRLNRLLYTPSDEEIESNVKAELARRAAAAKTTPSGDDSDTE